MLHSIVHTTASYLICHSNALFIYPWNMEKDTCCVHCGWQRHHFEWHEIEANFFVFFVLHYIPFHPFCIVIHKSCLDSEKKFNGISLQFVRRTRMSFGWYNEFRNGCDVVRVDLFNLPHCLITFAHCNWLQQNATLNWSLWVKYSFFSNYHWRNLFCCPNPQHT